jgi:hypothetical protein
MPVLNQTIYLSTLVMLQLVAPCSGKDKKPEVIDQLKIVAQGLMNEGNPKRASDILLAAQKLDPGSPGLKALIDSAAKRLGEVVSLPYAFAKDGIAVNVVSGELSKKAAAWNSFLSYNLAPNETWLVLSATVYEKDNVDKQMNWRNLIHVVNRAGLNLSPTDLIRSRMITYVPDQYKLRGNEREELRIYLALKEDDFPAKLVFADGKTTDVISQR